MAEIKMTSKQEGKEKMLSCIDGTKCTETLYKNVEKGLECCIDSTKCDPECPYFSIKEPCPQCMVHLKEDTLQYIHYLKFVISDLQKDIDCVDGINKKIYKETAKEILQRVVNICKNEEDFQDGTVNTQLEPLHFGIANGCAYVRGEIKELAKEYGVEVEE